MASIKPVVLEECRMIFRNFEGRKGRFNREGDRSFCVILPPDKAKEMEEEGWNVKYLKARDEGDEDTPYLMVRISYSGRPPRIEVISLSGKVALDEETVGTIDDMDIKYSDMLIRPYEWSVQGDTGISAYLAKLYVVLNEDELDRKYAEV